MAKFEAGRSGNPRGRPKSDTANLKPLLAKHGISVLQKVIDTALDGDLTACKLILDRLYPAIKPAAQTVKIPVGRTLEKSGENLIKETMKGNLPPDIGAQLITALTNQAKLIEITELEARIEALENK